MSEDKRPCQGGNINICVGEGCYAESCLDYQPKHLFEFWTQTDEELAMWWAKEEERNPVNLSYWPHQPAKHRSNT